MGGRRGGVDLDVILEAWGLLTGGFVSTCVQHHATAIEALAIP